MQIRVVNIIAGFCQMLEKSRSSLSASEDGRENTNGNEQKRERESEKTEEGKRFNSGVKRNLGNFRLFALKKNHKGKIIILYDDDERIAPQAATIMVERGYNNIFLLSGGESFVLCSLLIVFFLVPQV